MKLDIKMAKCSILEFYLQMVIPFYKENEEYPLTIKGVSYRYNK